MHNCLVLSFCLFISEKQTHTENYDLKGFGRTCLNPRKAKMVDIQRNIAPLNLSPLTSSVRRANCSLFSTEQISGKTAAVHFELVIVQNNNVFTFLEFLIDSIMSGSPHHMKGEEQQVVGKCKIMDACSAEESTRPTFYTLIQIKY